MLAGRTSCYTCTEGYYFSEFAEGSARCDDMTALAAQCEDSADPNCFDKCCLPCKKGMDLFKTVQEGARGFQSTVEKTVKQTVEGARGVVRSVDRSASAPSVTASERRITTSPPPPPPPTPEETSITGRSSPSSIQSEDDGFADRGDNA